MLAKVLRIVGWRPNPDTTKREEDVDGNTLARPPSGQGDPVVARQSPDGGIGPVAGKGDFKQASEDHEAHADGSVVARPPMAQGHVADVRQAPDGSIARISIKGSFKTKPEANGGKFVHAFKVQQTGEQIDLAADPAVLVTAAKFAESGVPLSLDLYGAPSAGRASPGDDRRMKVSFEWEDGELVGVRIEGDFAARVDAAAKVHRVFRSQHRKNNVRLTLDRSDIRGITRVEAADLGEGIEAKMYCPSVKASSRALGVLKKEPETIRWLDRVEAGSTLWDLGANVGSFTLYAAMRRDCRVMAFEPAASNYAALCRNIEINGLQDRVTAYCVSVARQSGLDLLYLQGTDFGDAFSNFGSSVGILGETFEPNFKQGSVGFSLDDLAASLPFPAHLKIDVDGLEKDIVLGGATVFADRRVLSTMIELDKARPELIREIADIMIGHGFVFFNEASLDDSGKNVVNAIFDRRG